MAGNNMHDIPQKVATPKCQGQRGAALHAANAIVIMMLLVLCIYSVFIPTFPARYVFSVVMIFASGWLLYSIIRLNVFAIMACALPIALICVLNYSGIGSRIASAGFFANRAPEAEYVKSCAPVMHSGASHDRLGFCEPLLSNFAELPYDIIYSSDASLYISTVEYLASDKSGLVALADNATGSELYQLKKILPLSHIKVHATKIGNNIVALGYDIGLN
jgi:hypothetical protein